VPCPPQIPSNLLLMRLFGSIVLASCIVAAEGCVAPAAKDRSLDALTEAPTRYPTAVSNPTTALVASHKQVASKPEVALKSTAPMESVAPANAVADRPLKTTPLQLPEEPLKTIPLPVKKDIPTPLPLAPHQRPLNFPLAVAPPATKPAKTANQIASSSPEASPNTERAAPPSLVNVPQDAPPPQQPADTLANTSSAGDLLPPPALAAAALQQSAGVGFDSVSATTSAYAPAATSFPSLAAVAQMGLNEMAGASFPPPGLVTARADNPVGTPPHLLPNAVASDPGYATAGYQPSVATASHTETTDGNPIRTDSVYSPESTTASTTLAEQQAALIAALEGEIRQRRDAKADQAEIARLELQLRLLYLLAERPDDAVAAIDALSPPERESCKHLLFGLAAFMADEPASRSAHRNAKVLRSLRDATSELAAGSRLDLRNMTFCEKVEYFGWYTEFSRYEFSPKQQVILYVEVENYAAESKGPQAFETELQGSYQIFDGSGQIIAERKLPLDRETCRNYRRDYFLAYRVYMPENISPGSYRLELTIEDLKARGQFQGRKLGQSTIDFTVR
jgi:hypothetical protein